MCNTDQQALDISPVPTKIALGASLTKGRGAGSIPEVGRNAAIENIEEIKKILGNDTQMIFITAGMGGGTGTGAAPVIAQAAKEMGILTVGIVTIPFSFEGKKRKAQAEEGATPLALFNPTLGNAFRNLEDALAQLEGDAPKPGFENLTSDQIGAMKQFLNWYRRERQFDALKRQIGPGYFQPRGGIILNGMSHNSR